MHHMDVPMDYYV